MCVCVCVCVCVCILHICYRINPCCCAHYVLAFIKLLLTFSNSMYFVCVIFCLFNALSRGVGALQISIIIFVLVWQSNYTHYNVMLKDSGFA